MSCFIYVCLYDVRFVNIAYKKREKKNEIELKIKKKKSNKQEWKVDVFSSVLQILASA